MDVWNMQAANASAPTLTYVAGADTPPPECVPLEVSDFDSEEDYDRIMQPWAVTDETGEVLPVWRRSHVVHPPAVHPRVARATASDASALMDS
nr:MAG: hypothetical protein DIU74_04400 [Pseudomonadota bacterium]